MITITLTTYDVTGRIPPAGPIQKSFEVVRIDHDHLVLRWSSQSEQPIEGTIAIKDWGGLEDQIRERKPHGWTT